MRRKIRVKKTHHRFWMWECSCGSYRTGYMTWRLALDFGLTHLRSHG